MGDSRREETLKWLGLNGSGANSKSTQSMPEQTFSAFATPATPGLITQQLAQGGYGDEQSIFEQLGQQYQDVSVPILQTPDDYKALGLSGSSGLDDIIGQPTALGRQINNANARYYQKHPSLGPYSQSGGSGIYGR